MPLFTYRAMMIDGNNVSDVIEAKDQSDAISKLREKDLFPTYVRLTAASR